MPARICCMAKLFGPCTRKTNTQEKKLVYVLHAQREREREKERDRKREREKERERESE